MKLSTAGTHAILGWALVLLSPVCEATHAHHKLHQQLDKKHSHSHLHGRRPEEAATVEKRGTCAFPGDEDPNLVAVTPDEANGGWAMSPDQECSPNSYCPYACKPGMVMAQWEPDSTYNYPSSMNGGLHCDSSGKVSKPFPNKPYCVEGTGAVKAVNKAGKQMSWCQTVLPGNEAMLIPTVVSDIATIAVPDSSYWCSTSAHFYINPPGTGSEGCIWGDSSKSIGNWSPFVAGANTDSDGNTFVKLGWNPIFENSILSKKEVEFGVKVECPNGSCNGLPCAIDPSEGEGDVDALDSASGAGGSDFCVVTVPKGGAAHIVAHSLGGGSSGGGDSDSGDGGSMGIEAEPESSSEAPTTTQQPTSTSTSQTPTTSTTTSTPTPTPTPTTTSTTSSTPSPSSSSASTSSTSSKTHQNIKPGIFHEHQNNTTSATSSYSASLSGSQSPSQTSEAPSTTTTDAEGEAGRHQSSPAIAGLVIAFAAAACFF